MTTETQGRLPSVAGEAADLTPLAELSTLIAAARDAMSDDIVTRLASRIQRGHYPARPPDPQRRPGSPVAGTRSA